MFNVRKVEGVFVYIVYMQNVLARTMVAVSGSRE